MVYVISCSLDIGRVLPGLDKVLEDARKLLSPLHAGRLQLRSRALSARLTVARRLTVAEQDSVVDLVQDVLNKSAISALRPVVESIREEGT